MKLHEFTTEFRDLISIVAADKHLPESAIERDLLYRVAFEELGRQRICREMRVQRWYITK